MNNSHALPTQVHHDALLKFMLGRNEPGAVPCGTAIIKGPTREGDLHPEGSTGVVRGSCGPFPHEGEPLVYGYLIEFVDTPHAYVFMHGGKGRLRVFP